MLWYLSAELGGDDGEADRVMGTALLGARADSGNVCTRDEVLTANPQHMESYHHWQNTECLGLI